MDHWTNGFEHPSITDENREAFNTTASKFASKDDMAVGYMELEKSAGKPFKLPKSLDKLPDDTVRADFTAQAHKLLGIEHAPNVEALADLNMKAGFVEGQQVDEALAGAYKQWVVKNKVPKAIAQAGILFHNQMMGKAMKEYAQQTETKEREDEAAKIKAAKACNEALVAHPDFGSVEKLQEQSELFRRAMQNNVGLTPEEYEQLGDGVVDAMITTHPVLARVLLKQFAPLAATSSHEGSGGGPQPSGSVGDPDDGSPSYVAAGFSSPEELAAWKKRQEIK